MKKYRNKYALEKKLTINDGSLISTILEVYFVKPLRKVMVYLYNEEVNIETMKEAKKEIEDSYKEFELWIDYNTEINKGE